MEKLLEVRGLTVGFKTVNGYVRALNGVSFDIDRQEGVGFVGESGCGKSVTARAVMRILEKNAVMSGNIRFYDGDKTTDISSYKASSSELRAIRGGRIAMISQEPMSALCPVYTVGNQLIEAILLHNTVTKKEVRERAIAHLASVGISRPAKCIDEYPWELSGGMRQRVVIAMALSCNPALLIADEPTTALDVTVSAQILRLLEDLQERTGMAVMMINHNLGVIAQTCSRVNVMYLGRIVESASRDELFTTPAHPYTADLLRSIPKLSMKRSERLAHIRGYVPDPLNIPPGCSYHNRCYRCKKGLCDCVLPNPREISPGHFVSCHLYDDAAVSEAAGMPVGEKEATYG